MGGGGGGYGHLDIVLGVRLGIQALPRRWPGHRKPQAAWSSPQHRRCPPPPTLSPALPPPPSPLTPRANARHLFAHTGPNAPPPTCPPTPEPHAASTTILPSPV